MIRPPSLDQLRARFPTRTELRARFPTRTELRARATLTRLRVQGTLRERRVRGTLREIRARRRGAVALAAPVVAIVIAFVVVLSAGASGEIPPETGAASIVPGDALAYVNVSLDPRRPAVRRALALATRFPDFSRGGAAIITRLAAAVGPGSVNFTRDIRPWLGKEMAIALLNTATSTSSSLLVVEVSDRGRAQTFLTRSGAVPRASYRGVELFGRSRGEEVAFVRRYLVLGPDTAVRAAIDVAAGGDPPLQDDPAYQRATTGEPPGRVLDAYASVAGVRRLLTPQGGFVGALGELLYQPALLGVSVSVSPAAGGARVQVHSALDPTLAGLNGTRSASFTPTLPAIVPSGAILMFDVSGLDRVASHVLSAGAVAGLAGGIGPLLARLGGALASEGVDVQDVVSIFSGETALAIVPHANAPTLILVSRTPDVARARTELAELELPLSQLFPAPSTGPGAAPEFNDHQVAGVTAHQISLASGLQLDYAVFGGLVVISTSLDGIAAVARHARSLERDPDYEATLDARPQKVTSLLFLDFSQLLSLGEQTGLTSGAHYRALRPDLEKIRAIGLSSTSGEADSTAELSLQIP